MNKTDRPTFVIAKKPGETTPKIQIGEDTLLLDAEEAARIKRTFERVLNDAFPCIPEQTIGCLILYDNGTIAISLSTVRLTPMGSEFIIIANYMFPGMETYTTSMFYVNRETLDGFVVALTA